MRNSVPGDSRVRDLLEPKKYGNRNSPASDKSKNTQALQTGRKQHDSKESALNPSQPITSPARTLPSYNPRALLNPRGARAAPVKDKGASDSRTAKPGATSTDDGDSVADHHGSRTMLEVFHGLQNRSDRPSKRIRVQAEDASDNDDTAHSKTHSRSSHRTNGGIIGSYMRPSDVNAGTGVLDGLVDLTKDDDTQDSGDDLKVIKAVNLANEQEVCFGMVYTDVHAHAVPTPSGKLQFNPDTQWPVIKCSLVRAPSDDTVIEVKDPDGFAFGKVATDVARVLAPIMDSMRKIRLQARLMNRPRRPHEEPRAPCSTRMKLVFNIYGRRGDAERIGRVLGQHNIWLKNPMGAEVGYPTCNPHATHKAVVAPPVVSRSSKVLGEARTIEEATQAVSRVFDHFANNAKPLDETDAPPTIITPLLPHQKQALTFMLRQEEPRRFGPTEEDNSSLWRKKIRGNGAVSFEDVVTGLTVKEEPEQVFGGLLADVMGLGKTLEALALIMATLDQARQFESQTGARPEADESTVVVRSRATLIVAPVSTVKNWEDQITEHIHSGGLQYYVYHGPSREKDPFALAQSDVVISTYSTIANECSKRASSTSPIRQIKWFRIILDEAHTIREPKAIQSQAMYSVHADRRWCLTGTPIQNRIDDLGSLTRFLRLYPYDTTVRFNQYIRGPAASGDANFLKALRIFVDSFTLRRLKDRIELPQRQDLVEKLPFSADEQQLHDFFKEISHQQVQEIGRQQRPSGKPPAMQYSQVLRGIMTLRLISAHGRELLKERDLEKLKGRTFDDAIDLENARVVPHIDERTAYETLSLMAEAGMDVCRQCDRHVSGDLPITGQIENEDVQAYVLPCLDIICAECFHGHKPAFDDASEDDAMACPWCAVSMAAQYIAIDKAFAEVLDAGPEDRLGVRPPASRAKRPGSTHTKTKALLRDLEEMRRDSTAYIARGEPPIKCVVFSEFTSHLDLLEPALRGQGHGFVRIDGSMSLSQRKRVLDELNHNDDVTVLLASIKAAGQGLNLTVASRAFIMEPLWNPAAEVQAVDRIYRIGQKREVVVKRYQMQRSIEEQIVKLQVKKQKLADLSMNKNHQALSRQDLRAEHLKDILDLFK